MLIWVMVMLMMLMLMMLILLMTMMKMMTMMMMMMVTGLHWMGCRYRMILHKGLLLTVVAWC